MSEEIPVVNTVVVRRDEDQPKTTLVVTPPDQPNIRVILMGPMKVVFVRAARVYLQVLIGFLTAGGLGMDKGVFPSEAFPMLLTAAQMALAPAFVSVLMNASELLAKVDVNFPQVRA